MPERATWGAPDCPFVIEYAPDALEGIRLAVSDAFFSLPRGGVEIGGVLLGKWSEGRLTISEYAPLDCEHAFGPSFTLSLNDRSKLADLIAMPRGDNRPVGWYHSHTRSAIFLSAADLDLHAEFFKEPWQVALVLKPHTYLPMRAGFFFRESGGSIHSGEAAYREFTLEPPGLKAAVASTAAASTAAVPAISTAVAPPADAPSTSIAPSPVPAPAPPAANVETLPRFLLQPAAAPQRWPRVIIPLAVGAVIGAGFYVMHDPWIPRALAIARSTLPGGSAEGFGLNTLDVVGELQVRWNRSSSDVVQAAGGVLSITDAGARTQDILLDHAHLLSGVFTVTRQSNRVDVTLTLTQPDGRQSREATVFLNNLSEKPPVEDSQSQGQQEDLADKLAKVRSDLDKEIEENHKLQTSVDILSKEVRDQLRIHHLQPLEKR